MHRSVRETQRAVDAHEFAEWMAYYTLEPWDVPVWMRAKRRTAPGSAPGSSPGSAAPSSGGGSGGGWEELKGKTLMALAIAGGGLQQG